MRLTTFFIALFLALASMPTHAQIFTGSKYTHEVTRHLPDGTNDGYLYDGTEAESTAKIVKGSANTLWIASYSNGMISEIDYFGNVLNSFSSGMGGLQSIAFDPSTNEIYAIETFQIVKFDTNGNTLASGSTTNGSGWDILLTAGGELYVTDGTEISRYDSNLNYLGSFASISGTGRGLAFDNSNNLYVVDGDNNSIEYFDSNGNYLGTFASGINNPQGLSLHDAGSTLLVASFDDSRIYGFEIGTGNPNMDFVTSLNAGGTWAVISIPEPGSLFGLVLAASLSLARRRRKS